MTRNINISDRLSLSDDVVHIPDSVGGFWAKTEVIGSYGNFVRGAGKTTFDMPEIFHTHNIVPVGGTSYAMQRLFEIPETQITIPTMKEPLAADYSGGEGIGKYNNTTPDNIEAFYTPDGVRRCQYKIGHHVCLFGVGITGTAENDVTIYHPDYRENKVSINKTNPDGLTVVGTLLPFRFTPETLSTEEQKKYFGRKSITQSGITYNGYFLKRFESDPIIKHIWKTGADVENEIPVENADMWQNVQSLNAVESFTEIELKISHKDIKEYFNSIDQPDRARINTIALFDAVWARRNNEDTEYNWNNASEPGDYVDVRLFAKLCINPEYLDLVKDLNILYRVFGS